MNLKWAFNHTTVKNGDVEGRTLASYVSWYTCYTCDQYLTDCLYTPGIAHARNVRDALMDKLRHVTEP